MPPEVDAQASVELRLGKLLGPPEGAVVGVGPPGALQIRAVADHPATQGGSRLAMAFIGRRRGTAIDQAVPAAPLGIEEDLRRADPALEPRVIHAGTQENPHLARGRIPRMPVGEDRARAEPRAALLVLGL